MSDEVTKNIPAIALRGMTILPSMIVHFDISRERSIKALEAAIMADEEIFLITQQDPNVESPGMGDLYRIGTVAKVKNLAKLPRDIVRVMVEGLERARLNDITEDDGYLQAEITLCSGEEKASIREAQATAMTRALKDIFSAYARENSKLGKELVKQLMEIPELEKLVDQISINLPLYYEEKQRLLEAVDLNERYELLCELIGSELEIIRIKNDLQKKVKEHIDKNQKEYILREQMKVIQEELGEDTPFSEADHYREKLGKLTASEEVKQKISKEIDRFKGLAGNSAEASVSRGYIETLLELPWDKM